MASRPKTLALTPGGLNLLAPVDQIPPDDCLQLDGWLPGAAGKLEQGLDAARAYIGNDTFANITSLCQVGGKFYFGGNTKLWRTAGTPIDTGFDTNPLGLTASQNYVWAMNQTKQRKDDGTNTSNWTTETPDFSVGPVTPATKSAAGTTLVAGDYDVYVTYQNLNAHQGNPSTKYTITIADGDKITVYRPTRVETDFAGWFPVTNWNVFIQSPGMAQPYQIPQNTLDYVARTYYDYLGTPGLQDDESVIAFDSPLAMDHDPAPAAMVAADNLFNSRVVVANSAAHSNRIFWTNASEPSYFPGSDGSPEGNWLDVGQDDGNPVLAITVRPGLLMIYRRRSIWRHLGDFDDPTAKLEPVVPDMGTVGVRSVVATCLGDFFVSDEGIYRQNDWPTKVTQKIEPLFRGESSDYYSAIANTNRAPCALGFANGRLWFSYPPNESSPNNVALVLHTESARWFGAQAACGVYLHGGSNTAALLGGGGASQVLTLDAPRANPIILNYQSGYSDCDRPDHEKTWPDLAISHNTRGQDLKVWAWLNKGAQSYQVATLNSASLTRQVIPLVYPSGPHAGEPLRAFNLSIQITGYGPAADPPSAIEGPIILHWYDRPRQAKVFDSGETDHGIQGYKELDQVELDVDVPAALWELQIWSDLGGAGMAIRQRLPLPVTSGRQMILLPLPTPLDGRLFRYVVASQAVATPGPTDTFELYGLRARLLPLGVYVDGSAADVWLPQPISIGV